jgi:hypothetical protein
MRTDEEPAHFFYQLDDPAFLAERARLRSRLEHVPTNAVGRPVLERLYEAMTDEFCRRARIAWTRGTLPLEPHWPAASDLGANTASGHGRPWCSHSTSASPSGVRRSGRAIGAIGAIGVIGVIGAIGVRAIGRPRRHRRRPLGTRHTN